MILPKKMVERIEYFEYTVDTGKYGGPHDRFVLYFKPWWKRKKEILIKRDTYNYRDDGVFSHQMSRGAAELYNLLYNEVARTYDKPKPTPMPITDGSNVISLNSGRSE